MLILEYNKKMNSHYEIAFLFIDIKQVLMETWTWATVLPGAVQDLPTAFVRPALTS